MIDPQERGKNMSSNAVAEGFVEPDWGARLDPEVVLRAIPDAATVAGMFPGAVQAAAKDAGVELPSARERYVPFQFYPTREHARLLVEASAAFYPDKPLRQALRKLGRAAPDALLSSTVGRVTLGSTATVLGAIEAMCNTYPVNVRPSEVSIVESSDSHCVISMRHVHFFLDPHHLGVFEGTLRYAGKRGQVMLRTHGPNSAELLCLW
jgi:uncharacterized protein (TIGR02265 family)